MKDQQEQINIELDESGWQKEYILTWQLSIILLRVCFGFCEYYAWFAKSKSKVQNSIDPTTRETINQSLG
jgi:hypothetical protein